MKHYTQEELAEVLRLHQLWMVDEEDGVRANLSGADLSGANLYVANLSMANLSGANLYVANLSGADLSRADLSGANLYVAYLSGANLSRAYLSGANLSRANLSGANLYGANLYGADLSRADLYGKKISAMRVFTGLYEYQSWAVVFEDGSVWLRMGCLWKSLEDWDAIGIRKSNVSEFPDDGSEKSERRARAFDYVRSETLVMAEKHKEKAA